MKLTRKLIPAFAMLLVSAVLMSTASFAWFSMNGNVTATGFSVEATAPAALWISEGGTDFGTELKLTGDKAKAVTISPVTQNDADLTNNTAANAASWKFHGLTPDAAKKVLENGTVKDFNANTDLAESTSVYKGSFYLLLEGQRDDTKVEQKNVTASVTVKRTSTATADTIYGALRVALVTAGGSATTNKSTSGVSLYEISALDTKTAAKTTTPLTTIAAQDKVQVYIYIWFEGTDEDCKNSAAQFMDDYTITLDFAAAAVGA